MRQNMTTAIEFYFLNIVFDFKIGRQFHNRVNREKKYQHRKYDYYFNREIIKPNWQPCIAFKFAKSRGNLLKRMKTPNTNMETLLIGTNIH